MTGTNLTLTQAASSCNCAERYCPYQQGPSGPTIPEGDVWGWDEAINACGPVSPGDQCAGLDVTCVAGYTYGWNGVDTCQCLLDTTKLQTVSPVCLIECIPPSEHDPNAVSTGCNCAKEYCPNPQGPGGPEIPEGDIWAYNATSNTCGSISDPNAECVSRDVQCVSGYTYGWSSSDTACECLPVPASKKRVTGPICDIVCEPPREYDPYAISVNCNCADIYCPSGPECGVGTSFGWNQTADVCACVASPEAECVAADVECIAGYIFGWDSVESKCTCLPDSGSRMVKKQTQNVRHGKLCTETK